MNDREGNNKGDKTGGYQKEDQSEKALRDLREGRDKKPEFGGQSTEDTTEQIDKIKKRDRRDKD